MGSTAQFRPSVDVATLAPIRTPFASLSLPTAATPELPAVSASYRTQLEPQQLENEVAADDPMLRGLQVTTVVPQLEACPDTHGDPIATRAPP